MATQTKCELCGLEAKLTVHHLIPKVKCHHNLKDKEDDPENHLLICRPCHDSIHANFTENELRDFYSTKEKLLESEEIQKFIKWRRKHPNVNGSSKMSNKQKNKRY